MESPAQRPSQRSEDQIISTEARIIIAVIVLFGAFILIYQSGVFSSDHTELATSFTLIGSAVIILLPIFFIARLAAGSGKITFAIVVLGTFASLSSLISVVSGLTSMMPTKADVSAQDGYLAWIVACVSWSALAVIREIRDSKR